MKHLKKLVSLLLCLLLALGMVGVSGAEAAEKTVSLASPTAWTTVNPFLSMDGATNFIHGLIWEPLFMYNMQGDIVPMLAESYEVNEEMTEYVIHLRQNAYFSDGVQVTADDVLFTYNLNMNPELASSRHAYMRMVKGTDDADGVLLEGETFGLEKVDDFTVKFTLKWATDAFTFLTNTRMYSIMPEHVLKDVAPADLENYDFFANVPGSGQLIYSSQIPGERMELTVNKNYARGEIDFDKLIVRVIPTANLLSAFIAGEADVCFIAGTGALPLVDYEMAKQQTGFSVVEIPNLSFSELAINCSDEVLSDVRIRQAICHAIDRDTIVQSVLQGLGTACYVPYAQSHPYFNDRIEYRSYDPEKAKALLAEAGWDGSYVLKFCVPSSNQERQRAAVVIQQMLEDVGIKSEIYMLDNANLFSSMVNGEYQLGMFGSAGALNPTDFVPCLTPGNGVNFCCTTDTRYAELYSASEKQLTTEGKKAELDKLQELINEECPYVFLFSALHLAPLSDRLSGVNYSDFTLYLYDLTTWKVAD